MYTQESFKERRGEQSQTEGSVTREVKRRVLKGEACWL